MEKINIAELLKYCPKGMELYSPIFGEVYLDKIRPHLAIVVATDKEQGDSKEEFLYDGRYGMNGECMLFPSKSKTTWEGFLPPCRFKVGDTIQDKDGYKVEIFKVDIDEECYEYISIIAKGIGSIPFKLQDEWELVPNKFDITTLKPFDKVLVRDGAGLWRPSLFGNDMIVGYRYFTSNGSYKECIPYEGNEHLLGTTDDCDEFYKTWK